MCNCNVKGEFEMKQIMLFPFLEHMQVLLDLMEEIVIKCYICEREDESEHLEHGLAMVKPTPKTCKFYVTKQKIQSRIFTKIF